ncbi:MAG: D-alanine--D-alanine ligase [Alphaproteobacteria bacterium]|nr:D-alanine--D-alanine ligase [Alphaproteobacteria bacterium]
MSEKKLKVAVLFGGRSPESDVSIVTGLQAIKALDPERYEAFPVYIAQDGEWLTGAPLLERSNYIPGKELREKLTSLILDLSSQTPTFLTRPRSFLQKSKKLPFDVALFAFHGLVGEDGCVQGVFETANVPYTGARLLDSAVCMDKTATKKMLASTGVPVLPYKEIKKPETGSLITPDELKAMLGDVVFPCCLKPANLGSSIGVARVTNFQEISDTLASTIFRFDYMALLEPFVENLVEYNVAIRCANGHVQTSAIERPKRHSELLDFKTKYLSGGGTKSGGSKTPSPQESQGMLSLTREINPSLPPEFEKNIRKWAEKVFTHIGGSGCPRLDFLCNEKTGEAWFNEANPIPGSFGYFLWEAAKEKPILFSNLLDDLIDEAFALHRRQQIPLDPTPEDARLFPRK